MIETSGTPKTPRPASTVILVREDQGEVQVYLLQRSEKSGFFPGNYVFPGGAVHSGDRDPLFLEGHLDLTLDEISQRLGNGINAEDALAYGISAIRETFEEAGVLLGHAGEPDHDTIMEVCNRRTANNLPKGWLQEWLGNDQSHVILDISALSKWSHWITPTLFKYRFDTRFFIAFMPPEQTCVPDSTETVHGLWINPEKGLTANLNGDVPLSPPTVVTLHELLPFKTVGDLKKTLETRLWGEPLLPRLVPFREGAMIIQPWDTRYDEEIDRDNPGLDEASVLPVGVPFSRIWFHKGLWRPVRY